MSDLPSEIPTQIKKALRSRKENVWKESREERRSG